MFDIGGTLLKLVHDSGFAAFFAAEAGRASS
jgi:hypothetical protein